MFLYTARGTPVHWSPWKRCDIRHIGKLQYVAVSSKFDLLEDARLKAPKIVTTIIPELVKSSRKNFLAM